MIVHNDNLFFAGNNWGCRKTSTSCPKTRRKESKENAAWTGIKLHYLKKIKWLISYFLPQLMDEFKKAHAKMLAKRQAVAATEEANEDNTQL